jgi:hypothetical protein
METAVDRSAMCAAHDGVGFAAGRFKRADGRRT